MPSESSKKSSVRRGKKPQSEGSKPEKGKEEETTKTSSSNAYEPTPGTDAHRVAYPELEIWKLAKRLSPTPLVALAVMWKAVALAKKEVYSE